MWSFDGLQTLSGPLPADHARVTIPGGRAGTAATIQYMQDAATKGKRNFEVRKLVGKVIKESCSNKDFLCYAKAIFQYCRDQVYYAFDPQGVELVEKPWKVLESGIADCDSNVPLLASMLENIGLECRYVTIQADTSRPDEFSHVFLECLVPGNGWIPMDPTMPEHAFGWGPDSKWPRKEWPATHDAYEDHGGDAMIQQEQENGGAKMSGYVALGYLNDAPGQYDDRGPVPGLEETVGVKQGNYWNWRLDPVAITATPDQLELSSLQSKVGPVVAETQDFFIKSDAGEVLREKAAAIEAENMPMIQVVQKAPVNWLLLAVVGLGAYALFRKER